MNINEITCQSKAQHITEDRKQLYEGFWFGAIWIAGGVYTVYDSVQTIKKYVNKEITGEELTARLGADLALAVIGGGSAAILKALAGSAVRGGKAALGLGDNAGDLLKQKNNIQKNLEKLKNSKQYGDKSQAYKQEILNKKAINKRLKKIDPKVVKNALKTFGKVTSALTLVPDGVDALGKMTYKVLGGEGDKDRNDSGTGTTSTNKSSSNIKPMSAADKATYGITDIKYDRNKSPETKAVFDKYSALGAKGLDYNKDNKIVKPDEKTVKPDEKTVKSDEKTVKPDEKTVKSNKDIKYDRNADVTQGSTISQKPVVKFNPVNQKPITNPNPTTVKDKDTGGIINKNIDKDFIEKNMPGKTLNKKGVIVNKTDPNDDRPDTVEVDNYGITIAPGTKKNRFESLKKYDLTDGTNESEYTQSKTTNNTKYEFLNNELAEAKYMRTDRDAVGRSSDNIAQGFFEHLLVLQQMRFENPAWAQKYAKDTMRYMSFNNVRTGATDLHNLASIVNNPAKYASKIGKSSSTINELGFKRYLRNIINGKYVPGQDRAFFLATQKSLGIKNSLLKQARRVMSDYGVTNKNERASVSTRLTNSFRQDSRYRSDVFKPYASTIKKNKVMPPEKKGMGIAAKTAIGMVGGAVAGYKLGQWASS